MGAMLLSVSGLAAGPVEIRDLAGLQRASVFTSPISPNVTTSADTPVRPLYTPMSGVKACRPFKIARAGLRGKTGFAAFTTGCFGCYIVLEWAADCPISGCTIKVCVATGAQRSRGCRAQVEQPWCGLDGGCELTDGTCYNPDCPAY